MPIRHSATLAPQKGGGLNTVPDYIANIKGYRSISHVSNNN